MSLDKAIEHGKEKRKQYRGSKAIDRTCRNHGTCNYCQMKRKIKAKKREPVEIENDWYELNDGWFTYFINVKTGGKKFKLGNGDKIVERIGGANDD